MVPTARGDVGSRYVLVAPHGWGPSRAIRPTLPDGSEEEANSKGAGIFKAQVIGSH
jgi:hypothetical protein